MNPSLISQLEQNDLSFVGQDVDGERMEIIELASKWALLFLKIFMVTHHLFVVTDGDIICHSM